MSLSKTSWIRETYKLTENRHTYVFQNKRMFAPEIFSLLSIAYLIKPEDVY